MYDPKQISEMRRECCRVCSTPILEDLLSLGDLYISTFVEKPDSRDVPRVPLALMACPTCELVQLRHTTPPEWLYSEYWYRSGINETMVAELKDVVRSAVEFIGGISSNDYVLDIGANDGTLIRQYENYEGRAPVVVAFEPSQLAEELKKTAIDDLYQECFPPPAGSRFWKDGDAFSIVTSIAMFYDLDDPHSFVKAVKKVLRPDGVWIIQLQDLDQMTRSRAFDNIGHEHLEYYSLTALKYLLDLHGLVIADVERREINGGSLRLYVTHPKHPRIPEGRDRVANQLRVEGDLYKRVEQFVWLVSQARRQIQGVLHTAIQAGREVDVYGASTKGNTLLQYLGINGEQVRWAVERSPAKWGRYTVGSHIKIVSEETWRKNPGDVTLVLIWQFRDAVLEREKAYIEKGGVFVLPLPVVALVTR